MQEERLKYLLDKYQTNSCTQQELQELEVWYDALNENEQTIEGGKGTILTEEKLRQLKQRIKEQQLIKAPVVSVKKYRWLRVGTAAAIIGFLCTGVYLFTHHSNKTTIAKTQKSLPKNDVAPGGNKAVLTLADGSSIILDSAHNGTLTQQGNIKVLKIDSGLLQYKANYSVNAVAYNTLSTPRGGQYQIVLADGSKVWLNAASSLRYPTAFIGKERNVELTGEAYFEVAKNATMPFHVKVNDMTVEVLGTHFNVMAYGDEDAIKTTLLEGSVKVVNARLNDAVGQGQSSMMKLIPGQQAQLNKSGDLKLVKDADVDEAVAWKEGRFQFNGTNINAIMRQVSRWYNVDVAYKDDVSNLDFSGIVSRSENASKLLKVLEATGTIHFEINGNKIIVKK